MVFIYTHTQPQNIMIGTKNFIVFFFLIAILDDIHGGAFIFNSYKILHFVFKHKTHLVSKWLHRKKHKRHFLNYSLGQCFSEVIYSDMLKGNKLHFIEHPAIKYFKLVRSKVEEVGEEKKEEDAGWGTTLKTILLVRCG